MQFHLNGFQPGDPREHAPDPAALPHADALPAQVDVLIVGCGPAGLTLAAQLAAFPEIRTCLVEQKPGPLQLGQADGIACRTMEMFAAFDFADRVLQEACWINEVTFWKPAPGNRAHIVRHGRVKDTEEDLSEFPHVVLNQARVHDFYLDHMRRSPSRLQPHYARKLLDLTIDRHGIDSVVHAQFECAGAAHARRIETMQARYVVGCDGARSTVRRAIGRQLVGDSANRMWGVMDVLAVTDFPDIRCKSVVQSADGNLLVIPREGGYLVRLYVELEQLQPGERAAERHITLDQLIAAAQRILRPHTLDVKEVPWWSIYEIGQRICDRYDDVPGTSAPAESSVPTADDQARAREPRIFIAGDACHTHSPQAGQGMNFSMQDSFNLGWKLAAVVRGQCAAGLLHTYTAERQPAAQALIDFDREWAAMFSDRPLLDDESHDDRNGDRSAGVNPKVFQSYFERQARFTAGMGTHYATSIICGPTAHAHLARGFIIGTRFHSAPVVRVADARPMQLGHVAKADGRWRLYAFAGAQDHLADDTTGVRALCRHLDQSPLSPVRRFTPTADDIDSVFDLRVVFQAPHADIAIGSLPALLLPRKGRHGLVDYEKVFCADHTAGADIFELRGIDRQQGVLVVVRPDQYIGHVLPLHAYDELGEFFAGFMTPAAGHATNANAGTSG